MHSRGVLLIWLVAASTVACAKTLPDPAARPIVTRTQHADQVCTPIQRPYPFDDVAAVIDPVAVRAALNTVTDPPTANNSGALVPPFVDVAINYSASGEARYLAIYDSNIPFESAAGVARVVRDNVRPLGALLEPLPVMLHLTAGAEPNIESRRSMRCMPHMVHDPDGKIRVPEGISIGGFVRRGDTTRARVEILVEDDGSIVGLQPDSATAPNLFPKIDALIDSLTYEPGLLNGEPVRSSITQVFYFRPPADSTSGRSSRDIPER